MNTLYYYDKNVINSIDDAYEKYRKDEFESPTRSTIALLSWLKHDKSAVQDVLTQLKIPKGDLHLEYSVAPKKGKGGPSTTDLMVIDKKTKHSLAIEAKWTESTDKTVKKWRSEGTSLDNREKVLQSWLELLQAHTDKKLLPEDFGDVINQTLHRAASACSEGAHPTLAYLCFRREGNVDEKADFKQELVTFWNKLGKPAGFPFYYIEIRMTATERYASVIDMQKEAPSTVQAVLEVMKSSDKLFDFKSPIIQRIE
ncbi:MAG: hypothetical protein WC327_03365 [Candidatus Cloacimonadia bacterium]